MTADRYLFFLSVIFVFVILSSVESYDYDDEIELVEEGNFHSKPYERTERRIRPQPQKFSLVERAVFPEDQAVFSTLQRSQRRGPPPMMLLDSPKEVVVDKRRSILLAPPTRNRLGKRAVGVIRLGKRGGVGRVIWRPGKRFDYDSYDLYDDAALVDKRAVVSILRPGKRDAYDSYDDVALVDKRALVSVIRPGKRLGYDVVTHGLGKRQYEDEYYGNIIHTIGKRTGYNALTHGLGKRTGYNVLTHGLGKRYTDDVNEYYDFLINGGMGKRGVISIFRPVGKRSYDSDEESSEESFEADEK